MATVVRMPAVLAGATEAAVASWLVAAGDTVTAGTPLAELETEKALVEYAAEQAGIVGRLLLAAGGSAGIGDPIAVLVADGESDADIDAALGLAPPAMPAPPAPVTAPAPVTPPGPFEEAAPPQSHGQPAEPPGPGPRIFASPLVRRLAGEKGIDVAAVAGTGPGGRIVRRDLERFLAATLPTAGGEAEQRLVPPAASGGADACGAAPAVTARDPAGSRLIPHTRMRRAIARRLTESKSTIPHFYLTAECVVDELLALRAQVNEAGTIRVSVNDFVIMAVAAAFGDVPEAHVTWSDEGLLAHGPVDLAMAVATEGGLVAPVLRNVAGKRLSVIAREARDLADRARGRRLLARELEGGAFAVSNLGSYGTLEFAAIINPPQSGILAVGAARPAPVVVDGALAVATVMRCTLSVDHRAIDGALAARWLAAFTTHVQHPLTALI